MRSVFFSARKDDRDGFAYKGMDIEVCGLDQFRSVGRTRLEFEILENDIAVVPGFQLVGICQGRGTSKATEEDENELQNPYQAR